MKDRKGLGLIKGTRQRYLTLGMICLPTHDGECSTTRSLVSEYFKQEHDMIGIRLGNIYFDSVLMNQLSETVSTSN